MVQAITSEELTALQGIRHGFFTRQGGVSEGIYRGLNCGSGSEDHPPHVVENRERVREALGAEALCSLWQIHSPLVQEVVSPWADRERPKGDAMVTTKPGIALGILTADCVPVLLADPVANVIGAAHAGWKGAQGGVIESTLEAMQNLGATLANIHVAIGPAIAQESYQVDSLFHAQFVQNDAEAAPFFEQDRASASHYRFDLKAYLRLRCLRAGLSAIDLRPEDTYVEEDEFYSYRRTCHRGESDYGRQISAIMLS